VIVNATLPEFKTIVDLSGHQDILGSAELILLFSILPKGNENMSDAERTGVKGITTIEDLFLKTEEDSALPSSYNTFYASQKAKGPNSGGDAFNLLSQQGSPVHIQMLWQATERNGKNTINLIWETKPLGDKLLSVKLKASATDPAINTRALEDEWMGEFLKNPGIKLISRGH